MEHDTHEAAYAERVDDTTVRCRLCPHGCVLRPGTRGRCLTRGNSDGRLVSYNYSRPVTIAMEPIEEVPLYHFRPGTEVLSMGANGCTLKCAFCKSSDISQSIQPSKFIPLEGLVEAAKRKGARGMAFTGGEPAIWFETIMELAPMAHKRGLFNIMATNGHIEPEPLRDLLRHIDAMNIDIKSMNPGFYRRVCEGRLESVLRACEQTLGAGARLEISYPLIPNENDSDDELRELTRFIAIHLGKDTPLHILCYEPHHRMTREAASSETLNRAYETVCERLDFVFVGNVPPSARSDTYCPSCGEPLVRRNGAGALMQAACKKRFDGFIECRVCGTRVTVRHVSKGMRQY